MTKEEMLRNPDDKCFSFNDFLAALEDDSNTADMEPYTELVANLARLLKVKQ